MTVRCRVRRDEVIPFPYEIRRRCRTMIEGLVALNPKKRRAKVAWVIASGVLCVLVALISDANVREAVLPPALATLSVSTRSVSTPSVASSAIPPQLAALGPRALPLEIAEPEPEPVIELPAPSSNEAPAPRAERKTRGGKRTTSPSGSSARRSKSPAKSPARRHGKRGPKA